MNLAETMTAIEQHHFAAEMNLAAGTKSFLRMMREHHLFQQLTSLTPKRPHDVAARIEAIAGTKIDEHYENPFDSALSAYILALSDSAQPEITSRAAQAILKAPKCWWSSGIAREALLNAVASGPLVNQTPRDQVYVRLSNSLAAIPSSARGSTTLRELMQAISAQQPAGQKNMGQFLKSRISDTTSKPRRKKHSHHQLHGLVAGRARLHA